MPDPKNKRNVHEFDLQIKQMLLEQKDKKELQTTGNIKKPSSLHYQKLEKDLKKRQTFVSQDNRTKKVQEIDQQKGEFEIAKKQAIKKADIVTDVLQLGNFVPHPLAQTLGKIGNVAGSAIDVYQAYDDFSNGDYGSAAINTVSAILPNYFDTKSFGRASKYSPIAKDLNNIFGDFGRTKYLNTLNQVKKQSTSQLNVNRTLLGSLGAETVYDSSFAYGGEINNNIDPIKKNNQLATRRDSLNLQKNYLLKEKQLEALGYKRQFSESGSYPEAHSLMMKNYNDVKNKETAGTKTQIIQPKGYRLPGIYPSNIYREDNVNNNENLYKSQEAGDIGVLNPQVPYSFYDKRIAPTKKDLWVNPMYNDGVVNYGYDFGKEYAPKPVVQNNSNIKRTINNNIKPLNNKIAFTTPASRMAYGGNLENNMENKNFTEFNEGGTHEQNPLGGVPLGENASVEQGETKKGKYIYSDRLSIDENMTKEMNLPTYIKGKSFANASKAINDKFKDRHDSYATETKNTLLKRLEQAQETIKAKDEQRAQQIAQSMQTNSQQVPDMMNGEIPEGMEEYMEPQNNPQEETQEQLQMAYGGRIKYGLGGNPDEDPISQLSSISQLIPKGITPFKSSLPTAALPNTQNLLSDTTSKTEGLGKTAGPGVAGYLGAAQGAMSLLDLSKGKGASTNKFGSAASGALTGAQAGMAFGPIGAGVGAVAGIGAGLFGSAKAKEQENIELNNKTKAFSSQFKDNNFAYGGRIKYDKGGDYSLNKPIVPYKSEFMSPIYNQKQDTFPNGIYQEPEIDADIMMKKPGIPDANYKMTETPYSNMSDYYSNSYKNIGKEVYNNSKFDKGKPGTVFSRTAEKAGDYLNKNGGKFLKYAPVAMSAYQLANLSKPENKTLQRLNNRYNPQYTDEARLQNIANQEMNNSVDAYSQLGGSQGAVRNAIIASGLNKTKGLSDAYMKANEFNNSQNEKAQQFNLGVDQFNTQTQHQESENHERNNAAYRNEKSKYLSTIGTDLGNIGKEEVNKNQISEALGYDWDGKYHVDKKTGEKLTTEELLAKQKETKKEYKFEDKSSKFGNISYNPSKYKF